MKIREKLAKMLCDGKSADDILKTLNIRMKVICEACPYSDFEKFDCNCIDGINRYLDVEDAEFILSEEEKETLKSLKTLGFNYIARDENGCLYAFKVNPEKDDDNHEWSNHEWSYGIFDICIDLDRKLFKFIEWEDNEPLLVEELLKSC